MTTIPDPTPATSATPAPLGPDDFDALDQALDAMREHDEETPQWESAKASWPR